MKRAIKLTRHARNRCRQRDIDPETVEKVAAAALEILNDNKPIRIRHCGHTIVAKKEGGQVKIISTWRHPSIQQAESRRRR